MESKELRNFARVARCGSFSRAADELGIAQPALSRQILKLEQELKVSLFVRHGRGVRLTNAGSLLLDRAETIAHLIHKTSEEVKQDHHPGGSITLGVPPAAGLLIVPALVARMREEAPDLTLHVREGVSTLLQEWLLDQRIDLAVLHNPPPLDAFEIKPILRDRMVVIGPATPLQGEPAEAVTGYRMQDLADLPLIMPGMPHNIRRLVEQAAVQHGVRLRVRAEVDSVAFTKLLVEKGAGFGVLTQAAVHDEVLRGQLRAYPIERPALWSIVAIVTRRDGKASPTAKHASATLRAVVRDLVQQKTWAGARMIV